MPINKALLYIVEDDAGIRELYQAAFEELYEVQLFDNASAFLAQFLQKKPNLCILDIMLPGEDGYYILSKIREVDELLPVIIVSAKVDEMSFVKGLNRGADDYMAKPFSILELLARVKTNLRRTEQHPQNTEYHGFFVDTKNYTVSFQGTNLFLTLKEYYLMQILVASAGATVTREQIFKKAWDTDFIGETRTLDMHISSVRDKIEKAGGGSNIITVRGVGFRLE